MASQEQIKKALISNSNELSLSITSEENLIGEEDLELSLAFHTSFTKIPLSFSRPLSQDDAFITKREVQALRRFEANKKRDLKRKVSGVNGEVADVARDVVGHVSKAPKLNGSCWAPHSDNSGGGQNGNLGSTGKNGNVDESISTGSSSGASDDSYQCFSGPGENTKTADAITHSSRSQSHLTSQNNTQTRSNSTPNATRLQTHLFSSWSHSKQVKNSSQHSSISANSMTSMAKEAKGKPPRPNGQIKHRKTTLPQMPCVSVTGNGPNGKTITGILYKYTKTEVSIVCVCHGVSFSPAGFVEHAGGIDVEHPLRHIRVVSFAL